MACIYVDRGLISVCPHDQEVNALHVAVSALKLRALKLRHHDTCASLIVQSGLRTLS